jgi:hypothetical protein
MFVDGREEHFIGVQSRLWVEDSGRHALALFHQLDDELSHIIAAKASRGDTSQSTTATTKNDVQDDPY